ncbi:MAG: transcriptional initiation protein Tat [Acetobacteraceae bacterium]|jgi:hypothetical protein
MLTPRRRSLQGLGFVLAAAGLARSVAAAPPPPQLPVGAHTLEALSARLSAAPRRRDFKTSPMILERRDQWDADALDLVLHYTGGPKQSWDNTDISGPWLNVMRNSMNSQVWSFKHPDFLCVSATHGSAQLALYDDEMWEKYALAKMAGGNVTHNSFVTPPLAGDRDPRDFENPTGPFSSHNNSILALQRRGAVFLACHNAVWELSERLIAAGTNPDKLAIDALCAELTNHLIPDVVATPGAVGTLVELGKVGFIYAR